MKNSTSVSSLHFPFISQTTLFVGFPCATLEGQEFARGSESTQELGEKRVDFREKRGGETIKSTQVLGWPLILSLQNP